MLSAFGGWESDFLPFENRVENTPVRWTRLLMDKLYLKTEEIANKVLMYVNNGDEKESLYEGLLDEIKRDVYKPLVAKFDESVSPLFREMLLDQPAVRVAAESLTDLAQRISSFVSSVDFLTDTTSIETRLQEATNRVINE